jgi:hypothetical protein
MEIKITDAGRQAEGYTDEKLDCVVRAYASAADVPYYQSHAICEEHGRKRRHKSYNTINTIVSQGHKWVFTRMSLATFVKEHPIGNFFVTKRGHAFAVKNGIVFDTVALCGRVRVIGYAEIVKQPLTK